MSKAGFFAELKKKQNDTEISDLIEEYRIQLLLLYLLEQKDELPESIIEILEDSSLSDREKIIKSVNSLLNDKVLYVILRELLKNREAVIDAIYRSRDEILEKISELANIEKENTGENRSRSLSEFKISCRPEDEASIEIGKRLSLVYIPSREFIIIKNREDGSIVFSGESYLQEIDAAIVTDIIVKHLQLVKLDDRYYKLGRNSILGNRIYSFSENPDLFERFVLKLEERM